jgi:hypothetical protein
MDNGKLTKGASFTVIYCNIESYRNDFHNITSGPRKPVIYKKIKKKILFSKIIFYNQYMRYSLPWGL